MNNETFGMTLQYAICAKYNLENNIATNRIDVELAEKFLKSNIINEIFQDKKPIEYLTTSKKFTSPYIKRCPHTFLLTDNKTFSIKTFKGKKKMFAPKVVGQSGDKTFNHFFGDLDSNVINRENFKKFCIEHVEEMLPIIVDYALVSDYNCWMYLKDDNSYDFKIIERGDFPELVFDRKRITFTNPTVAEWGESNTVKYDGVPVAEFQIHRNRTGYKIRLHRDNFPALLEMERKNNNSLLGDTAELAICAIFNLDIGSAKKNSSRIILEAFKSHYLKNKGTLFPLSPIKYSGTEKRERGSASKSGVDFVLEQSKTLSVKTNKSKSFKVCPSEIGQPSPKTFDLHFSTRGWYEGNMTDEKFRDLVRDKEKLAMLLGEYASFLNECDFLLWSLYVNDKNIHSKLIGKSELANKLFLPELISYSNDFISKSSVTIKYGSFSLGEFQIHSARNSLKFRFNLNNLLSI